MNQILLDCYYSTCNLSGLRLMNELIDIIAWPAVTLTALFVLKKPITELFHRIKKIGNDKASVTLDSHRPHQQESESLKNELIDSILSLVSKETKDRAEAVISAETNTDNLDKNNILYKYSQALYISNYFRETYFIIYGSQIRLLQALNGSDNENLETLYVFFESAKKSFPELYQEGYTFAEYLNFLKNSYLINSLEEGRVVITAEGRDFLKFITAFGYSIEKPY